MKTIRNRSELIKCVQSEFTECQMSKRIKQMSVTVRGVF